MKNLDVSFIFEKGTGALNEDYCLINGSIFGVFDGATSLNGESYDGLTGGHFASNISGNVFYSNNADLRTLAENANTAIFEAMRNRGVDVSRKENLWSTSFAVVRIEDDIVRWSQIGDCIIIVINRDGSYRLLTKNCDHDLETLLMWKEVSSESDELIMERLRDKILEVRKGMNRNYGVLNGEPEAMEFLKEGSVALSDVKHILLFTDGFFIPKEDPSKKEDFEKLTELYKEGGLKKIRNFVREIEAGDRECRKYPRFKEHDDMAAVALTFRQPSIELNT